MAQFKVLELRQRDPDKRHMAGSQTSATLKNRYSPLSMKREETPTIKPLRRSSRLSMRNGNQTTCRQNATSRVTKRKAKTPKFVNSLTGREMSPLDEAAMDQLQSLVKRRPRPTDPVDVMDGMDFAFPKVCWGEKETAGKSAIQRADREIEQWQEVRRAHVEAMPEVLPFIDSKLEQAKSVRKGLTDCEENHRVGYVG